MNKLIEVNTGEVKAGRRNSTLRSNAIGSCIVVAAYNKDSKFGVFAHIMLPGKAPSEKNIQETRYAENAIEKLIYLFKNNEIETDNLNVCLVGGANVLKNKKDNTPEKIYTSLKNLLLLHDINIVKTSIGGTLRRSVSLNVESGKIFYTIGDGEQKLLYTY